MDENDIISRKKLVRALIREKDDPRYARSPNLRQGLQVAIQVVQSLEATGSKGQLGT